jgi:predicted RNase H-related nuclease YkuK (DUF458 family)
MQYKRLYDSVDIDLVTYVRDYISGRDDVEILVGTDSQNYKYKTVYVVAVALYTRGRGAHVIYRKWSTPLEKVRNVRLLNEVWYSVEAAQLLTSNLIKAPTFIDIDLNPDPKYKSNEVFRAAVGLVESMGYTARYKTLGPIVTYCADQLCKS